MQQIKFQRQQKSISGCGGCLKFLAVGALLLIVVGIVALFFGKKQYDKILSTPNSDSSEKIEFTIEEGKTIDQIAQNLSRAGLLRDEYTSIFTFYLKQSGIDAKIQAGQFRIPANLTIKELAQTLQNAGVPDLWVTVPEGVRADEIADALASEFSQYDGATFSKERFMQLVEDPTFIAESEMPGAAEAGTLEGYLFPDRYLLPVQSTEELVLTTMLENFRTKVSSQLSYEELIVASMLEREGRGGEERAMIADIIYRRHDEGWFLNIDATLLYYHKDWKHLITIADKEIDHPYNTYQSIAYPPTPICNPTLSSINAALNPEKNDYYYYIHDNSGQIHYAKTLSQHSQNIAKYLSE